MSDVFRGFSFHGRQTVLLVQETNMFDFSFGLCCGSSSFQELKKLLTILCGLLMLNHGQRSMSISVAMV